MKLKLKSLFFTLIAFVFITNLHAQGWVKTYDYEEYDSIHTLLKTPTGYLLVGETIVNVDMDGEVIWSTPLPGVLGDGGNRKAALLPDGSFVVLGNTGNAVMTLWKFTSAGILDWSKNYNFAPNFNADASSVALANDGGFILLNRFYDTRLIKTDQNGQVEWQKDFVGFRGYSVVALADGGYAFTGYNNQAGGGGRVKKTDSTGNELWEYQTSISWGNNRPSIIETSDGNLVSAIGNKLVKLNQVGDEFWAVDFNTIQPNTYSNDIIETTDGIIAGVWKGWGFESPNYMALYSSNGQILQTTTLVPNLPQKQLFSMQKAHGEGWVVAGAYIPDINVWSLDMILVKTDDDLVVFSDTIHGNVFLDADLDCEQDAGELGLHNAWSVKAAGDLNFWASPDADGNYELLVPPGDYSVSVHPPYPTVLWEACESPVAVQLEPDMPVELDFAMTGDSCPYMEVQVGSYYFRPCLSTSIVVSYSNHGLITAENATVSIVLDSALTYVGATIPLASQDGQTLWFDLGDVEVNGHGLFFVEVAVACDQDLLGQTLCYTAHIYPDTTCGESFNGPNIEVNATCIGDSVQFTLTNVGTDMPDPLEYIVIEDNLIMMTKDYQLPKDESLTVTVPASNGATQHLIVEQDDALPLSFGNHYATASIEGCVGSVNVGAFGQFPPDDGEHWLDIFCLEVTNSYDPNDKLAFPTGWTDDHFIEDRTELEYLIRFQNTGTDTAFNVTLIDTLSPFLDPATIRPGASSHPYRFELSGQGVAKFIFEDIMLPDSNVNEPFSHGFAQFRIAQMPGNQPGTVIENTAGIYFDFNAPVYTNTTFHTIVADWIHFVDDASETAFGKVNIQVFPNPMADWAVFEIKNLPNGENTLLLFDVLGRAVLRQPFAQGKTHLHRNSLENGLYFFSVENGGKPLATGKIVIR